MSDAAFPTAAYPTHTNRELQALIDGGSLRADAMRAELARRAEVAAGDMTNATPGERLRAARAN
jgi:hypothetical protein